MLDPGDGVEGSRIGRNPKGDRQETCLEEGSSTSFSAAWTTRSAIGGTGDS
jgi:hypothetical protein